MRIKPRDMMGDAGLLEEGSEFSIFSTPIGLHGYNLFVKQPFNKVLKLSKLL
jgi:hypothetical protein